MSLRVGIIGCGVVGGSLKKWFENYTDHVIKVYDPGLGRTDDLSDTQYCFIAVPVPTKSFKQDLSILEESVTRCPKSAIVFVRSTVLPGTCDYLAEKYERIVCAMPEFLTERTAYEDTERLGVVLGVGSEKVHIPIDRLFPGKEIVVVKNQEAEMAKYVHNCFGAMKVTYFNGVYDYCERKGMSYDRVLNAARITPFIGPYHAQVPGPDGLKGFGGKCFPKDLVAFMGKLQDHSLGVILRDVYLLNRFYRGEKQFTELEHQDELIEKTS